MSTETVTLTSFDIQRLEPLLARHQDTGTMPAHLLTLTDRLALSAETEPSGIPADVVTMNSRVRLQDLGNQNEVEYQLTFPSAANTAEGRISVLAPLGACLLGARVGSTIEVRTPGGVRRLLVRTLVFQPEAEGRYDM